MTRTHRTPRLSTNTFRRPFPLRVLGIAINGGHSAFPGDTVWDATLSATKATLEGRAEHPTERGMLSLEELPYAVAAEMLFPTRELAIKWQIMLALRRNRNAMRRAKMYLEYAEELLGELKVNP